MGNFSSDENFLFFLFFSFTFKASVFHLTVGTIQKLENYLTRYQQLLN